MVGSRTATALAGLLLSLLVSVVVWRYTGSLLVFLFVPFVPVLLRRWGESTPDEPYRCPACGFATSDDAYRYCPRDGTRLERADRRERS